MLGPCHVFISRIGRNEALLLPIPTEITEDEGLPTRDCRIRTSDETNLKCDLGRPNGPNALGAPCVLCTYIVAIWQAAVLDLH